MSAQTAQKIYEEIKALKQETKNLKELILFMFKDSEGEYKDDFIKRIIGKSKSNPSFVFKNRRDFLRQIS